LHHGLQDDHAVLPEVVRAFVVKQELQDDAHRPHIHFQVGHPLDLLRGRKQHVLLLAALKHMVDVAHRSHVQNCDALGGRVDENVFGVEVAVLQPQTVDLVQEVQQLPHDLLDRLLVQLRVLQQEFAHLQARRQLHHHLPELVVFKLSHHLRNRYIVKVAILFYIERFV